MDGRGLTPWRAYPILAVAIACSDPGSNRRHEIADGIDADAHRNDGSRTSPYDDGRAPSNDALLDQTQPADSGTGTDANAGTNAPPPDASSTPDASPPESLICGDTIRDPVTEECDDGLGNADDSCTPDCRIRDLPVAASPLIDAAAPPTRHLGTARHQASASPTGFAVAFTETRPGSPTPVVRLQPFDQWGARDGGPIDISPGTTPTQSPNPAVAALGSDRYAVAWIEGSGGTPDVAIRLVAGGAVSGPARYAHASRAGPQEDPDLLWTGTELLVAWTDLITANLRRFTSGLSPIADEQSLSGPGAIASNVSLTLLEEGWAVAWRSGESGFESIVVRSDGDEWRTEAAPPGPSGDHPALVEFDGQRFLLLYTVGTDPSGGGSATIGRLRFALLDRATPGTVVSEPLVPLTPPYDSDESLGQRRPSAVRVGEHVFVAWESESPNGSAFDDEVWLQELQWDPSDSGRIESVSEQPLSIAGSRAGDQRNPALAVSPIFPGGALISLWEDSNGSLTDRATPDVMLAFRPVPFVTLDFPDASIAVN